MKDITANKYVLPSIQREYVWDTEQIEALFDSLMRDYPIGTFLFWEINKEHVNDYDFYGFIRNYHEYKGVHNKKVDLKGLDGVTAVLDGQQRLTSIYIGLKGTYAYKLKYMAKKKKTAKPAQMAEVIKDVRACDSRSSASDTLRNDPSAITGLLSG